MADLILPEDRTGLAATNRVTSESHIVNFDADADFHFFVPKMAPFYKAGVVLYKVVAGNRVPQVEGKDFNLALQFMTATVSTAKPVFGAIVPLNVTENATYILESYQSVGGGWTLNAQATAEMLANIVMNPRGLSWEQVVVRYADFNPTNHPWSFSDMVGQSEVVASLTSIAAAIAARDTEQSNHPHLKGNVHDLSKHDLDLGLVPNYPPASIGQAVNGEDNETLMTPLMVKTMLNAMGLTELGELALRMKAHLDDKENPHDNNAQTVGLGWVENYPHATVEDITLNRDSKNVISLETLKLYLRLHGNTLIRETPIHIEPGSILHTYCKGNVRYNLKANGVGGTIEVVDEFQNPPCKLPEGPAVSHQNNGEVVHEYCSGTTSVQLVANGNGGFYTKPKMVDDPVCSRNEVHPDGYVINATCEGTVQVRTLADGKGGMKIERIPDHPLCLVNNPYEPAGVYKDHICKGFEKWGRWHDGKGGLTEKLMEPNSSECGYTKPVDPPPPAPPPEGEFIRERCGPNFTYYVTRANGRGGEVEVLEQVNAVRCGYQPPVVNPPPPPANVEGSIVFSTTLTNSYTGDTEIQTVQLFGWKPNTRYNVELWIESAAMPPPTTRKSKDLPVVTDRNGDVMTQFTIVNDGFAPPGVYASYARVTGASKQSNVINRTLRGSR